MANPSLITLTETAASDVPTPASNKDSIFITAAPALAFKDDTGTVHTVTGGGISSLTGDVTATGPGAAAATIANAAVTLAKIANAAANSKLVGSGSAGSGAAYSELTLGSGLSMSGTTLSATGSGGTVTTTGSPATGNLTKFTGASTISNGDLTGDVTTTGTLATTLKTAAKTRAITLGLDGGGSAITTGIKADVSVPYACTITAVTMLADQSGSIVVDIWKDTYANYPPVVGDSITASAKPTITTATKSTDATLTGWTTSVSAGDTLRFNVDSATTITRLALTLTVTV